MRSLEVNSNKNNIEEIIGPGEEAKDEEVPLIVHYPPMITRISECKNCF